MRSTHKKLGGVAKRIRRAISGAQKIIIASHKDPDPDAIGSQLGLWHILKNRFPNKLFYLYNPTRPLSPKYRLLDGASHIKHLVPQNRYELLIGLDAGNFSRLGLDEYVKLHNPKIIFIDHHETHYSGNGIVWIERDEESAAQLIYELASSLDWPIDKAAAEALLIGITGDTLHFSLASPHAFDTASKLMKRKPAFKRIDRAVFGWPSLGMMRILAKVFLRAKFLRKKRFIYSYAGKKEIAHYGVKADELAYISNKLLDYIEAEAALFLKQRRDGKWEGSLRSVERHPANLDKLAGKLGGGGHKHAAGFEAKLSKDVVLKKILRSLPNRR